MLQRSFLFHLLPLPSAHTVTTLYPNRNEKTDLLIYSIVYMKKGKEKKKKNAAPNVLEESQQLNHSPS